MLQLTKKKSEKAIVGLEFEAGSVAAAEIHLNGGARLAKTAVAPIPPGTFEDGEVTEPEALGAYLKDLFSREKLSRRVRLGIANQKVVVRTLRLPKIDDPTELGNAIRFEAEERIPMPIDQAVLDHRVIRSVPAADDQPPQLDVVVVAARRDMIAASLRPLREAGLDPVGVDLSAFGLIRALGEERTPASDEAGTQPVILHCNVGDATNLAVAQGRACLFTRVAPGGIERIATDLAAQTGLTIEHARLWLSHVGLAASPEQIEGDPNFVPVVRAALEQGLGALLDEVRLSLEFYGAQVDVPPVERILLSGPGAAIPGLAARIEPAFGLPTSPATPSSLAGMDAASAARLTVPYGLALED